MKYSKNQIMTYSEIYLDPFDIQAHEVNINDIAHSLSQMTRANGHLKNFYSIAQHSVNCAIEAKNRGLGKRIQLACLLHDAAESYIADVPRPVKHRLVGYAEIEQNALDVIFSTFGIADFTENKQVKEIDDAMLYYELEALMNLCISEEKPYISIKHDFSQLRMEDVESRFLYMFYRLSGQREEVTDNTTKYKIVGVDGCRGGWTAFIINRNGYAFNVYKTIEELCRDNQDAGKIIIDMPIGLPESINDIRPDREARKILKGKSSSIFNCPCRQAVYEETYEQANLINKKVLGKGLSKQSFAIAPKIREIDTFLKENKQFTNILVESHPEVCFAILNGRPVMEKKKENEGVEKRLHILSQYYDLTYEAFRSIKVDRNTATDDIVDAMCLAIVGKLANEQELCTIPEKPQTDNAGLVMQMVYALGGLGMA